MSLCDLTTVFPILKKAADAVRSVEPDLARNFEEFKDCVEAFQKLGTKADLSVIENQVVIILDKAEGYFNTDSIDAAVFIAIEIQRAAQAKFAADELRCKAHIDNVICVKIIP